MPETAHHDGTGKTNNRGADKHADEQRVIVVVAVARRIVSSAEQLDAIHQVIQQRLFRRGAPQHQFDQGIDQQRRVEYLPVDQLRENMAQTNADYYSTVLQGQYEQQLQEVLKYQGSLGYYRDKAVPQANLIIGNAQKSFENGAIDYVEYFQNLNQGLELKFNYLNTLNGYNQAIINLEYLIGQ